ncbi:MAG: thiamine diphosphokinase [Armatimonadota bacterium]
MLNRVIILANGQIEDLRFYRNIINDEDFIICANGGTYLAFLLGITPDMIIGDIDSIDKNMVKQLQRRNTDLIFKKYPKDKDKSDLELAIDDAVLLNPGEIIVLAALGGRIDHELINIFLPLSRKEYLNKIKFLSQDSELYILDKKTKINGRKDKILTLVPLTPHVKNVLTNGLRYEIKNKDINWGSSLTLSNIIVKDEVSIEYKKGMLLAVLHASH